MNASLQDRYDEMWQAAQAAFAAAAPDLDHHLLDKAHEPRRGATLLIRPHAAVAGAVAQALARLRQLEPDQHYYAPEELHVTVLSLFTGTADPEPYLAQLPLYRRAEADARLLEFNCGKFSEPLLYGEFYSRDALQESR